MHTSKVPPFRRLCAFHLACHGRFPGCGEIPTGYGACFDAIRLAIRGFISWGNGPLALVQRDDGSLKQCRELAGRRRIPWAARADLEPSCKRVALRTGQYVQRSTFKASSCTLTLSLASKQAASIIAARPGIKRSTRCYSYIHKGTSQVPV